ncbi:hypothetical protein [Kocuria rosea]|uniref:hypothetical protein n=1 Tax=Kocuria rosea TaxID=1275 RepID=UPI00119FE986|nr:hypothetical protein [Kocuria rosea]
MDLIVDLSPVLFRDLTGPCPRSTCTTGDGLAPAYQQPFLRSKEDLFPFLFPVLLLLLMLLSKGLQEGRAIQCGSRESGEPGSPATACLTARWRPYCPSFPLLLLLLLSGYPWRARSALTCLLLLLALLLLLPIAVGAYQLTLYGVGVFGGYGGSWLWVSLGLLVMDGFGLRRWIVGLSVIKRWRSSEAQDDAMRVRSPFPRGHRIVERAEEVTKGLKNSLYRKGMPGVMTTDR